MLALTIWEPWASLIMWGWKPIENRSWLPRSIELDERFAIHAGKWDPYLPIDGAEFRAIPGAVALLNMRVYQRSAILGTVRYCGSIRDESQLEPGEMTWWSGPLAWRVGHPVRVSPISMRGSRGLWTVPVDVAAILSAS